MKKKIVAFAVTAAMIVTSAVPVFAVGGWGEETTVVNENPNVVVVDKTGITTEEVKGDLEDGVEFRTVVDFNSCKAFTKDDEKLTLSLNFAQEKGKSVDLVLEKTNLSNNSYTAKFADGTEEISSLSGICGFDWKVTEDGVSVTISQYGKSATPVGTLVTAVPAGVSGVISLYAAASVDGNDYIMYENYPENIQSVKVVDAEGEAAGQPVAGETLEIESITLDYDTVLSAEDFDLANYVSVRWTATKNGKSETIGTGLSCKIEDNDKTKGAVIGVTVTYKEGTGIYGNASWGGDNAPLAVAERLYGEDRYDTAIQVAEELRENLSGKRFKAVVVADGRDFADALSGTALADVVNAPILLVNPAHEDEVVNYIKANMDYSGKVYILGGETAVSADFETAVERFDEIRLGGANRYVTNIAILKQIADLDETRMDDIAVCAGMNYPDALSVSATGMPVLLVGRALTAEQDEYLKSINSINDKYYLIGGTTALSADIESELKSLDYVDSITATGDEADVIRIAGGDRYTTNKAVVEKFFAGNEKAAYIASGDEFADALTGGALAAINDKPLLLVNEYNTVEAGKIVNGNGYAMTVIGGTGAVSAKAVQDVYNTKVA